MPTLLYDQDSKAQTTSKQTSTYSLEISKEVV